MHAAVPGGRRHPADWKLSCLGSTSAAQLHRELLILVMDTVVPQISRVGQLSSHAWLVHTSPAPVMVSTPSLPSVAHEVADSIILTDEGAERFLEKFPLVRILE